MSDHLSDGDVARFAQGALPTPRVKEVVRHLLQGCGTCGEPLLPLLELPDGDEAPAGTGREYDAPIARALAAVLSGQRRVHSIDRAQVEAAVERLRNHPRGIYGLIEATRGLKGAALLEVLLQRSFEERYRNPREMLRYALLATTTAHNLDPRQYSPEEIADHRARAWAEFANAHRVMDEFREAAAAFRKADEHLREGTGNLLLVARVTDLKASLLNEQRLLSDACELLDEVHNIYLQVGDEHLAGRALISKGIYTYHDGYPAEALTILHVALPLLDHDRDPQLLTSARECILEVMVQCGEFRAAATMLLESGLRQALADQPLNLVSLRWVEGQILVGLGKPRRAETALLEARAGFREYRKEYKAALVGLDLAALWLRRGEHARVTELAADMLATFQRLGIQREARRALAFLHAACEHQVATPGLVRHVGRFLRDLERQPSLRFMAG